MKTIIQQIENLFKDSFTKIGFNDFAVNLTQATKPEFGDYQVNGVMPIAKHLKKNPRELANIVIENLPNNNIISKIEIAGPGFINVVINDEFLIEFINELNLNKISMSNNHEKNIVVDYSSPNLAKEMHVGHLRSTVIGDALSRILQYFGYNVIRQNHVGDWGTQFGMLITYILENEKDGVDNFSHDLADLEDFYRKAKLRFDQDENFAENSRKNVVILQNWQEYGEFGQTVYKYWQYFTNESFHHCQNIYELLNIQLSNKDVFGESKYNTLLPIIIEKLEAKNLIDISNGAKCVFIDKLDQDKPPFIVQKNDGGYLYSTTDLAAIDYRVNTLKAYRVLYVVDARQSLHFEQLFKVAKMADIISEGTYLEHIAFGTMMGEDGKPFKTRDGSVVKLIDLINEAKIRAEKILQEKNPNWDNNLINQVARIMSIGALKYADLSKNRTSDYIFSFDKMLAFDGNTAPYLLYALTRINSLIKKSQFQNYNELPTIKLIISNTYERNLILHLTKFTAILNDVVSDSLLHLFCQYLYNLAVYFMQFYENCNILKEENNNLKNSRIKLLIKVSETLNLGLSLLGIETVEQM